MAVLGLLAGGLIAACVLPQLVAALRASDVSGVSVTGSTYAAASCAGWTLYATEVGLVEVAWSSAIGATLWGTIAVVVTVRAGRPPSSWVGLWAGSIVVCATVIGPDGLGMLLLLEAVTNTVPHALRARRQAAGVSPQAFLTMGAGAACWAVYGLGTGDAPLAVSSAVKTAMCVTIVGLLRPRRRAVRGASPRLDTRPSRAAPNRVRPGGCHRAPDGRPPGAVRQARRPMAPAAVPVVRRIDRAYRRRNGLWRGAGWRYSMRWKPRVVVARTCNGPADVTSSPSRCRYPANVSATPPPRASAYQVAAHLLLGGGRRTSSISWPSSSYKTSQKGWGRGSAAPNTHGVSIEATSCWTSPTTHSRWPQPFSS